MYVCLAIGLGVGVITLFSMTKIWSEAFWKDQPEESAIENPEKNYSPYMIVPVTVMSISALLLGFSGDFIFQMCMDASEQLLAPEGYINAVLGGLK
jgi:multicomponent Na+:H+ antiporter subunit D